VWYFTQVFGDLCPFGYGQVGVPPNGSPTINGNGLSIYKNPSNGVKTLVLVFSAMNAIGATTHNAVKIGINSDGSPFYSPTTSRMFLNPIGMDGARFLNPARPGDLYISNFQFNAPFIRYQQTVDAKVAVQVVQFTPSQLNVNTSISSPIDTLKFCSPSAGPIRPLADLATAPLQSNLVIKLFNSLNCDPLTTYSTASDPAALNLAPGLTNPINIPHTSNACNNYRNGATLRSFKMRCLGSGQMSNGIYGSQAYLFSDFASNAACSTDGTNPILGGGNGALPLLNSGS
jgi:hypothetical protein